MVSVEARKGSRKMDVATQTNQNETVVKDNINELINTEYKGLKTELDAEKAAYIGSEIYKNLIIDNNKEKIPFDFIKEVIGNLNKAIDKYQKLIDKATDSQYKINKLLNTNEDFEEENKQEISVDDIEQELIKSIKQCLYLQNIFGPTQDLSNELERVRARLQDGEIFEVLSNEESNELAKTIAKQLLALIKEYGINNISTSNTDRTLIGINRYVTKLLNVRIPPVTLQSDDGKFWLELSSCKILWDMSGTSFWAIYDDPSYSNIGRAHPHVMENKFICLGSAIDDIGGAAREGRIFDIFKTIELLLNTWKRTDEHRKGYIEYDIRKWKDCKAKCDFSGETFLFKDAVVVNRDGKEILVHRKHVFTCPVTRKHVFPYGDNTVEYKGVYYHKDAVLTAPGHEPVLRNDKNAAYSTLSGQIIHPALVATCEISGIQGKMLAKQEETDENQHVNLDDIIEIQTQEENTIKVAICCLDLAMLDEETTFGKRTNLLHGYSVNKINKISNIVREYGMQNTHQNRVPPRRIWTVNSPAWNNTYRKNREVLETTT